MGGLIGVNLLGGYAHSDGSHGQLPRKSRALLAYLAMQGARGASREQIADLLWASSEPSKARHSLRQELASLRRALARAAPDPVAASDRDLLALTANAIAVDVHRFEEYAHSETIADLAAASELYRGPFLDGFDVEAEPFQAWARSERARLEGVAADVLRRLAKAASEAGDSRAAIAAASRLTALDPLNEGDQQTLMRLLIAAGHRVEALRSYERLRDALRAELDVAPNETTRALARALRAESRASQESAPGVTLAEREPAGAASMPDAPSVPSLRPLAILACEWIGIEALPDERQAEAITSCYQQCGECLESRGARVARNASDGIIAYFGYEETREQDAENCARAALELRSFAAGFSQKFGAAFQLCAGVACGRVIVRTQPGEKGPEAVGSAVNLACWLSKLAAPGEILIEPRARKLVGGLFEYGASRFASVRGFASDIKVAPILSESGTESRFEALRPRSLGPIIGREEEIERLSRRWRQVIEGEGAVVLLVGEPGIGKSRLARAFLDQLGEQGRASLRLFCSPNGANSPLHPFTSFLKRTAGDHRCKLAAPLRRGKLAAMIADAKLSPDVAAWLAPILGISEDSGAATAIGPSLGREKMLRALATLIETRALTSSRAALVVIEDVHWADPTTIELLDRFAETASQRRLLLILTARPEYSPSWAGRAQTTTVTLARLTAREAQLIVAQTPAGSSLPAGLVETIIDRAEGVPLFLEELTQAVVEKRAGFAEGARDASAPLEIPQTLDGVLLARLDRLGPARAIVQTAAALGRTFMPKVIQAAANVAADELERALERLVASDWVWRQGAASEREYVFRHALLQDAAYHSLPVELRRPLHSRLVTAIETQCPEIVAAQPEVLAHHCFEAGQLEKAAALWTAAGQLSLAQSALHEAAAQFERALAILANLPSTKRGRADQLVAQVGLANALMHTEGYAALETRTALDRARRFYARAEELNEPPKDPSILLAVLHGIWVANHVAFDGPAVRELSQTFMTLAKNQESNFARAIAHRIMGTSLLFLGEFLGARLHLDRTLALYDPVAHRPLAARFGQDAAVAVLSNRPLALWLLGHVDQAEKDAADAIAMARNVGHLGSLLYMLTRIAWIKLTCGDYQSADSLIRQLSASATDVEGSYWIAAASLLRGCYDALIGDAASGVELIDAGVAASRTRGAKLLRLPWYFYCLARAHARLGELEQARACLDEAFAAVASSQEAWPEAELHRLAGELALASNAPEPTDARRHFERALAVARRQHAKMYELRAAMDIACLYRDFGGEPVQAIENLRRAIGGFTTGSTSPDVNLGRRLLAEFTNQNTTV